MFWAKISATRRGNQLFHAWDPEPVCHTTRGQSPKVHRRANRPFKVCSMCVRFIDGGGLMARPKKDPISALEWLAIADKGDRKAAGIVSELRGANVGSISQREAGRRRVSHEWVAQQRKERQKTQPSENQDIVGGAMPSENQAPTYHTGTRIDRSDSPGENAGVQQTETGPAAKEQVVANRPGGA